MADDQDLYAAMAEAQAAVDAINDTDDIPDVVQNLVPGALEKRDAAIKAFEAAADPDPASKPEYAVVWSGKNNIGDMSGNDWMRFVNQGSISPHGPRCTSARSSGWPVSTPWSWSTSRKLNVDGTRNPDYGKVVNFVQVPPPFGVEGEPHHMQYEWQPGQPIIAGHLFTDLTSIWDVSDIPNITLQEHHPAARRTRRARFPDAYDFAGDTAPSAPTWAARTCPTTAVRPARSWCSSRTPAKGLVQESETPASKFGAIFQGNAGGIPEPCTLEEARPLGTCANPHGIQIRPDLGRMVTNDYADARELGSDPVKTDPPGRLPADVADLGHLQPGRSRS